MCNIWELSVPSLQLLCKSITILKLKVCGGFSLVGGLVLGFFVGTGD